MNNKQKEILKLIKNKLVEFKDLSQDLKNDKNFVISVLSNDESEYEYLNKQLKNDREILSLILNKNGKMLYAMSSELKNDKEIALLAVSNIGAALEHVSATLKNDRDIVLKALMQHEKDDFDIFADDIKYFIGSELKKEIGNKDPVLYLQELKIYQESQENLPHKEEIAVSKITNKEQRETLNLVKNKVVNFKDLSKDFKNNKEFVIAILNYDESEYKYLNEEFKNDKEIISLVLNKNGRMLYAMSDDLKNDKEIALLAVSKNGGTLQHVSATLKNDKDIVLKALIQHPEDDFDPFLEDIEDFIGKDLKKEIGTQDPIMYLQKLKMYHELQEKIPNKEQSKVPKLKI